jgi:hypothetical protein
MPKTARRTVTLLLAFAAIASAGTVRAQAPSSEEVTERLQEGLPLAPTRTLSGTFSEGSWISLDVSPDGPGR